MSERQEAPAARRRSTDASPPLDGGRGAVLSVVGPDGVGKTTLIEALLEDPLGGVPVMNIRNVGILPRRTAVDVPVTEPHRDPPYSTPLSLAKLGYVFVDYVLGWYLRVARFVRRGGWVVIQRGWWDMAVDPRRYRLNVPGRLLSLLARVLPGPDLILVLDAAPEVVFARKTELSLEELARQQKAWRDLLPPGQGRVHLDASRPVEEVIEQARRQLRRLAPRGSGSGWANLPPGGSRWKVPRAPRAASKTGLAVYHPVTPAGVAGWTLARGLARLGAVRLLPAGEEPPEAVTAALEPHVDAGATIAVARTNHPGRHVALVADASGDPRLAAKIATDEQGRAALAREAEAITDLGKLLSAPLSTPRVVHHGDGVLLLEAVRWRTRPRPWRLPEDVAYAIGLFFRARSRGDSSRGGLAHGDFAPWNLLRTEGGWTVIDWEEARDGAPPFWDVFHYLVQGHALLRRPRQEALVAGFEGRGWVGAALQSYAEGAVVPARDAAMFFPAYLEDSRRMLNSAQRDGRAGLNARTALLRRFES